MVCGASVWLYSIGAAWVLMWEKLNGVAVSMLVFMNSTCWWFCMFIVCLICNWKFFSSSKFCVSLLLFS